MKLQLKRMLCISFLCLSNGDIRYALNILEICAIASDGCISKALVEQFSQIPNMSMDSDGDGYYDVLSGFQNPYVAAMWMPHYITLVS